ncbi:MAG TPA: acyltransferase [Allosphingosinicella sp.]|jgi:peptidoglycan/LPS O-acetylase OafA/YrhL
MARNNQPAGTIPLESLDFLRGIAALYVLANHTRGAFFAGGSVVLRESATFFDYAAVALLQLTALGMEFVVLFFVLSGFAMAHSVSQTQGKLAFYRKRMLRIWPPYIAAVFLAAAVAFAVSSPELRDPAQIAGVLLYINADTHITPQFWSLPYEVLFYLLCPFIIFSRRAAHLFLAAAVALCLASSAVFGIGFNATGSFFLNFLGNELLFFAVGAMAYHHVGRIPVLTGTRLGVACCVLFLACLAVKLAYGGSNLVSNVLMVGMTVLLIRNVPQRLTSLRWLNVGHFSYSIYIFHYAFIVAGLAIVERLTGVTTADMTSYWAWACAMPPILFLCWLLYHVTERPCNQMLKRLRQKGAGSGPGDGGQRLHVVARADRPESHSNDRVERPAVNGSEAVPEESEGALRLRPAQTQALRRPSPATPSDPPVARSFSGRR